VALGERITVGGGGGAEDAFELTEASRLVAVYLLALQHKITDMIYDEVLIDALPSISDLTRF
jgi:hypothetical protein